MSLGESIIVAPDAKVIALAKSAANDEYSVSCASFGLSVPRRNFLRFITFIIPPEVNSININLALPVPMVYTIGLYMGPRSELDYHGEYPVRQFLKDELQRQLWVLADMKPRWEMQEGETLPLDQTGLGDVWVIHCRKIKAGSDNHQPSSANEPITIGLIVTDVDIPLKGKATPVFQPVWALEKDRENNTGFYEPRLHWFHNPEEKLIITVSIDEPGRIEIARKTYLDSNQSLLVDNASILVPKLFDIRAIQEGYESARLQEVYIKRAVRLLGLALGGVWYSIGHDNDPNYLALFTFIGFTSILGGLGLAKGAYDNAQTLRKQLIQHMPDYFENYLTLKPDQPSAEEDWLS